MELWTGLGWAWDALAQRPMLNLLLALYAVCGGQLWLVIIVVTALVRLALLPASARQVRQSWQLAGLQPQLRANRARWVGEPKRLLRENMRLYRGAVGSPVWTAVSVIAQLLVLGALYLSLLQLFSPPDEWGGAVYPWLPLPDLFPLHVGFLWLDLSEPDPTVLALPLLTAASTWGVMRQSPGVMTQTGWSRWLMLWAFPALVGMVLTGLPSWIALYQTVANAISIGVYWALLRRMRKSAQPDPAVAAALSPEPAAAPVRARGRKRGGSPRPGRGGGRRAR